MAESEIVLLQEYARTRDGIAFRELVEKHQDMVFAACHRVLGNRADAEDAAQNCFLKLAQAADRLKAPIGGWLHTVAVRSAIDMLRRKTVRRTYERAAAKAGDRSRTHETPWADVRGEVDAAIVALPERLRTPVVLYFLEGHTQAEVAAELGITRPSVSKRLRRGMEALRRRLKRAGIMTSVVALPAMLSGSAAEAAPATLVANLGKMALAGTSSAKAAAVTTGGTFAALKTAAALVAAAGAGAGALAIHQATRAPHPAPIAAAAAPAPPVVKKALPKPEAVPDMELTLPPGNISLRLLAHHVKRQTGVYLAQNRRTGERSVYIEPGKHKVRDVLVKIEALAPLQTKIVIDRDRVAICLWQKPDAQLSAELMKQARSKKVIDRCTAARWLGQLGGRDALAQLLKMLTDPNARVRYYAIKAVADEWGESGLIPCVAPQGLGLALARTIPTEKKTLHASDRKRRLFKIISRLRDPKTLPFLKKQMELETASNAFGMIPGAIAAIGTPEAEAILLEAHSLWSKPEQWRSEGKAHWILRCLPALGTDAAIARLRETFEGKNAEGGHFRTGTANLLHWVDSPATEHAIHQMLKLPGIDNSQTFSLLRCLAKFDTPKAREVCVEKLKIFADDPAKWQFLAGDMRHIPAVREMLFAELTQGGVAGRRAACVLAPTADARLLPKFREILLGGHKDTYWAQQRTASKGLTHIGNREAEEILLELAQKKNELAIQALGFVPTARARKALRTALKNPNVFARNRVAQALAWQPDPEDIPFLLAAARMTAPEDQMDALPIWDCVAAIGGKRAAAELVAEVAKGSAVAAQALLASENPHCAKAVRDVLTGGATKLGGLSLKMKEIPERRDAPLNAYYAVGAALAALPRETNAKLRAERATLLAWARDPRGTDALSRLLVDARQPTPVRHAAAQGLVRTHDPAGIKAMLYAYKRDADEEVRQTLSTALQTRGIIKFQAPEKRRKPKKDRQPKKKPVPQNPPDQRQFPRPPAP